MYPLSILKQEAAELIHKALGQCFEMSDFALSEILSQVMYPEQLELAHIAFPCHPLAKKLRLSPLQIATKLAHAVAEEPMQLLEKPTAVNGYLNFFCNLGALADLLLRRLSDHKLFTSPLLPPEKREKIVVEYSQPNTHKALHVGHVRNMVYGDAVCLLLGQIGHEVIRVTYPGDLGAHIAKCLWYIEKFKNGTLPIENQAEWLGETYAEADAHLRSPMSEEEEAVAKEEIAKVLRDLEAQTGTHYKLYCETRETSLKQMREVYTWLRIHFDHWYFESECDAPSRKLIEDLYAEGRLTKSEGAIGMDLSQEDLGFVLLLKSDGAGLYLTKDLELLKRKHADFHPTRSIVVVDSRQKLHFKQLFKTAEKLGFPHADRSIHLSYESVTDESGKAFSSRELNGVQLSQLKEMLRSKIISQYLEAYRGTWSDAEIENTADQVALGALKYGFLKVDSGKVIRFILDDWIKLEGDTGPYLQYALARCHSILDKLGAKLPTPGSGAKMSLSLPPETELLLHLEKFNSAALQAGVEYRPSVLCTYLFDLAKLFNRFYKECPIKNAESEEARKSRLHLVLMVSATLFKGLSLLGIPAPRRL